MSNTIDILLEIVLLDYFFIQEVNSLVEYYILNVLLFRVVSPGSEKWHLEIMENCANN